MNGGGISQMDKKTEKKIAELIGENLDRLVTIDWRCQGQIHPLYQVARQQSEGPLTMRAAQKFAEKIVAGDVVFILTGFPVSPSDTLKVDKRFRNRSVIPETDGVVSAALIARTVDSVFKARPVIFCEEECIPIATACGTAAGLRATDDFKSSLYSSETVTILPFTKDASHAPVEADKLLDKMKPKAAISIERPGRNEKGQYHTANGLRITDFVAKLDDLFDGVSRRGGLTIGIGDLGNELGMGSLKDATKQLILYGEKCQCGCGAGIGASVPAEAVVFGAVSDDVAYAFLACLSYLLSQPEVLQSEMMQKVLEAACINGAIDGPSGLNRPLIDYLDVQNHIFQIELMKEIVRSPARFMDLQPTFYGGPGPR
jgi:hypothetical protein